MSIRQKLDSVLKPNALIGRTVWSSPQQGESCHLCKYWMHTGPKIEYDPADQDTFRALVRGECYQLRIRAAYGDKTPHVKSYFCCNFYEEKEKEDGKANTS